MAYINGRRVLGIINTSGGGSNDTILKVNITPTSEQTQEGITASYLLLYFKPEIIEKFFNNQIDAFITYANGVITTFLQSQTMSNWEELDSLISDLLGYSYLGFIIDAYSYQGDSWEQGSLFVVYDDLGWGEKKFALYEKNYGMWKGSNDDYIELDLTKLANIEEYNGNSNSNNSGGGAILV